MLHESPENNQKNLCVTGSKNANEVLKQLRAVN